MLSYLKPNVSLSKRIPIQRNGKIETTIARKLLLISRKCGWVDGTIISERKFFKQTCHREQRNNTNKQQRKLYKTKTSFVTRPLPPFLEKLFNARGKRQHVNWFYYTRRISDEMKTFITEKCLLELPSWQALHISQPPSSPLRHFPFNT